MKRSYKYPTPELLETLHQAREMEKSGDEWQDFNVAIAELKLACVK